MVGVALTSLGVAASLQGASQTVGSFRSLTTANTGPLVREVQSANDTNTPYSHVFHRDAEGRGGQGAQSACGSGQEGERQGGHVT